jgi:phenylpropionate dioxygenase-like ring-hydroxylating dioxygenase large terminal subunit
VFPGFVVQLQPDWMWFLRITPIGTGGVRIAWQVSVAPELLADLDDREAYVADLMALIHLVNSEDQPIVEGIRRSVHRPQFDRGPLSHLERNVYDFDRYVSRRLSDPTT